MGVRPKVGLPAVYLGDLGGEGGSRPRMGRRSGDRAGNPLSSTRLEGSGRLGGKGDGVGGIWSHRSSFSFLISWALSLQTDEGGREGASG